MSDKPYEIKLCDGKYTVINEFGKPLTFLRYGEAWPGAEDLRHTNVVKAMADRIEELEKGIRDVVQGTLIFSDARNGEVRNDNGMRNYTPSAWSIPLQEWQDRLELVLKGAT